MYQSPSNEWSYEKHGILSRCLSFIRKPQAPVVSKWKKKKEKLLADEKTEGTRKFFTPRSRVAVSHVLSRAKVTNESYSARVVVQHAAVYLGLRTCAGGGKECRCSPSAVCSI